MTEKTLVIVKPDGVQRSLVGRIISRFEEAGLTLHAMRFQTVPAEVSRDHYQEHVERPFYPDLERYITSGPVLVLVLGGVGAIAKVRQMIGGTVPAEALPGTIRGDWAHQPLVKKPGSALHNLVHASANAEDAERELKVWFTDDEIVEYPRIDDGHHGR
jgi:nucleoside-diphosphate kinase